MSEQATQVSEITEEERERDRRLEETAFSGELNDVSVELWADLDDDEKDDWEENLEVLDTTLERHDVVVKFKNPIDPNGKPIRFLVRPMTPGEISVFQGSLFGHSLLEASRADKNAEDEIERLHQRRMLDKENAQDYDTRMLQVLEDCIIKPRGITAVRLSKWDPFFLNKLFDGAMGGMRAARAVDRFHKVDPQPGE